MLLLLLNNIFIYLNRRRELYQEKKAMQEANVSTERRQQKKRAKKVSIPNTPEKKASFINKLIEQATPTTAGHLSSHNIKQSRERHAENSIVDATSTVLKSSKPLRKELLPQLLHSNKKAVAKRLGISRTHFYHKSAKVKLPRLDLNIVESAIQFFLQT